MAETSSNDEQSPRTRRRATTLEGRENQLISLATDLAEKQMRDGSASASVIVHYLKLGTTREKLEQEKIRNENLKLQAMVKQVDSATNSEALYAEALKAMRAYSGNDTDDELP